MCRDVAVRVVDHYGGGSIVAVNDGLVVDHNGPQTAAAAAAQPAGTAVADPEKAPAPAASAAATTTAATTVAAVEPASLAAAVKALGPVRVTAAEADAILGGPRYEHEAVASTGPRGQGGPGGGGAAGAFGETFS